MTQSHQVQTAADRLAPERRVAATQQTTRREAASKLRSWWTEPLVIFVAIAALIFVGEHLLRGDDGAATIVVSAEVQRELLAMFAQRQGRAATSQEAAQLVRSWVDDEVLLREGLKLELPRQDPALRDQLIARVRALLQSSAELATPADPVLRQFYEAHREDYSSGPRLDFSEYIIPADAEGEDVAREILRKLQHGQAVSALPVVTTQRDVAQLVELYGRAFSDRLLALPLDSWQLLRSTRSLHVVRIEARTPRQAPDYEPLRERLLSDFRLAQQKRQFAQQLESLRTAWTVRVESAAP